MSMQVCPANLLKPRLDNGQQIESVCHVPDTRDDHRCLTDDDCGIDSLNCRRRSCSMAGYCGLWLLIWGLIRFIRLQYSWFWDGIKTDEGLSLSSHSVGVSIPMWIWILVLDHCVHDLHLAWCSWGRVVGRITFFAKSWGLIGFNITWFVKKTKNYTFKIFVWIVLKVCNGM